MEADRQGELNALRPDPLRSSRLQLRVAGAAEGAVQETMRRRRRAAIALKADHPTRHG